VTVSVHARGIVIAGALAALALALGFVTLAMNQTASQAAPHTILTLKARHAADAKAKTPATKGKKKVAAKRANPNLVAALKAGLPRSVAEALARRPIVVVELWSKSDPVGTLSAGEAQAGAALTGAAFVGINVDADGGAAGVLTAALGKIPEAPAALIYTRPATLVITLPGFNDRTAIQQAVSSSHSIQSNGSVQSGAATTQTTSVPNTD
jgi:hypothetical protein